MTLRNLFYPLILILVVTIMSSCSEPEFARFNFDKDLGVKFNSEIELPIEVIGTDIQTLELEIGNEIVQKWSSPTKGVIKFKLKANDYGLGTKYLTLIARNKSGDEFKDNRMLRIVSDLVPEMWKYEIVGSIPHNQENFTQGFEFNKGQLYESTGQNGSSKIAKIDLKTGKDIDRIMLDATHFGEGITILNDTIYQLTWTTGKCFLYDANSLQMLMKEHSYKGEGWGITNDGESIIMSDGSERLTFRDPKTFAVKRTIEVLTHEQPVPRLNELEYVDGYIYANVWMTNTIVVIEPETGRVLAAIDGSKLAESGRGTTGEVFNGIAYNKTEDTFYLTGKMWEKIYKIKLTK